MTSPRNTTYTYTTGAGQWASTRLDRWYVRDTCTMWVRHVERLTPGSLSDHDGESVRLVNSAHSTCARGRKRVYSVVAFAATEVTRSTEELFDTLEAELKALVSTAASDQETATLTAAWWGEAKLRFKKLYISCSKTCRLKLQRSYRQRHARLLKELRVAESKQQTAGVSGEGSSRPDSRRRALIDCKRSWATARSRGSGAFMHASVLGQYAPSSPGLLPSVLKTQHTRWREPGRVHAEATSRYDGTRADSGHAATADEHGDCREAPMGSGMTEAPGRCDNTTTERCHGGGTYDSAQTV